MNLLGIFIAFIEWYDTAISIAFTNILHQVFFPNFNNIAGFSISLALVSISCLGKPIGAYFIGSYSDTTSRIYAAYYSFIVMITCSFLISFLPSFAFCGYLSPILFFILKFIQGIAIGGNYSTSVYSIEQSKSKYLISSLTSFSVFTGFFLANSYNALCYSFGSDSFNLLYSWRIGFFLSSIFSIPVFILFNTQDWNNLQIDALKPLSTSNLMKFIQKITNILSFFNPLLIIKNINMTMKKNNLKMKTFIINKFSNFISPLVNIFKSKYYLSESNEQHHILDNHNHNHNNKKQKMTFFSFLYYKMIDIVLIKESLSTFLFTHEDEDLLAQKDIKKILVFKKFLKASFLVLLDVIPFQYFHVFLPNYKIMILGYNEAFVRIGTLVTLLTITIITPIVGKLSDKHGPGFFLKCSSFMMMMASSFNYFNIIKIFSNFYLTDIYFGAMMAFCYGTLYCYLPLKFNQHSRAKLSGLALNITTSIVLLLMPICARFIESCIFNIFGFVGLISLQILYNDDSLFQKEKEKLI